MIEPQLVLSSSYCRSRKVGRKRQLIDTVTSSCYRECRVGVPAGARRNELGKTVNLGVYTRADLGFYGSGSALVDRQNSRAKARSIAASFVRELRPLLAADTHIMQHAPNSD